MAKFRKKPVVIEAVQNRDNPSEIAVFFGDGPSSRFGYKAGVWSISTLEGVMDAQPGDWIIKGIAGEFYPCKPSIFDQTYEAVIDGSC